MELARLALRFILILVVVLLAEVGVIWVWRRFRRRGESLRFPSLPDLRPLLKWSAAHRQELIIGLVLLAVATYVWAVTPREVLPPFASGPVERPPLAGLERIWRFLRDRISTWRVLWPPVAGALLAALGLAGLLSGRRRQALRAVTLLALPGLALEGQLFLLEGQLQYAAVLYGLALVGFIAWLAVYRPTSQETHASVPRLGRAELALLTLVLALTVFARFYALPRIPYGVEGDEAKWTIEVVSVMFDRQHTIQSEYHYPTMPVSFYMQYPFHRLLGPGVLAARVAVATFSVLGSLAFYWLVRELFGPPVALLATTLLAVSLVDVSAGRLAPVEAHVKCWAIAGLAFLVHGWRVCRPLYSFLGGVVLAIGLLTYDTFAPVPVVAVSWLAIALADRRATLREWVTHLTALFVPLIVVAPFVAEYLIGRMQYYHLGRSGWYNNPAQAFLTHSLELLQNFWQQPYGDFLFDRSGPILNSLLTPLLLLGFALALSRVRRAGYALPALWFALLFFPVPIYTGSPHVRVFYPGYPAVHILIAVMALLVWREISSTLPTDFRPALLALGGLALGSLIVLNLYIYFNDLNDRDDRRIRRELADMVTQAIEPGRRVYVPYFPESSDPVQFEHPLALLEARRKLPADRMEQYIWIGAYEALLPTISREGLYTNDLALIVHRAFEPRGEELAAIMEALHRCLHIQLEREGRWFALYVVSRLDIEAARCVAPRAHLAHLSGSSPDVRLHWWMEDASGPAEAVLACRRLRPDTLVVEAEDMQRDDGWEEDWRYVTGFRGRGYLADRMVLGSAYITVTIPAAGAPPEGHPYTLWVRMLRRTPDPYPFHLSIDGHTHTFMYTEGEPLGAWTWIAIPELLLGPGEHTIRMARPVQEYLPDTLALFVDTLLLVGDPAFNPQVESEWLPGFTLSQKVQSHESSGFFWQDGVAPGRYRCQLTLNDGERLVDWNGEIGVRSNTVEFTVGP
ncbi:MAG: glycosyltransferase family 39 protein [Anaerolineae bacterium]|nr:glycosyltransferase family 39 protein [Anaerolineae bacterium]